MNFVLLSDSIIRIFMSVCRFVPLFHIINGSQQNSSRTLCTEIPPPLFAPPPVENNDSLSYYLFLQVSVGWDAPLTVDKVLVLSNGILKSIHTLKPFKQAYILHLHK